MNQKLSGVAASLPALPSPSLARTPAAGPSTTPPVPVLMMRPAPPAPVPPVALPLIRQMTVATVTRNLVAALAPEAPPLTPTTQGFPNFVSRNFQQVSQHRPGASNAGHLSGLAELFATPAPANSARRQRVRPAQPAPTTTVSNKIEEAPAAKPELPGKARTTRPPGRPPQTPQPTTPSAPQTRSDLTVKTRGVSLKPEQPLETPKLPDIPKTEVAKPAPAQPRLKEEEKKPPQVPVRGPRTAAARIASKVVAAAATTAPKPAIWAENKATVENPKVETRVSPMETRAVPSGREQTPLSSIPPSKIPERLETPPGLNKATAQAEPVTRALPPTSLEKVAQARPETSEIKVGELQRQQVNALQPLVTREQLALAQESGAGLSAGGGFGHGGSGGQQGRQQRRQQDSEQEAEEIAGADCLGGDDQVHWWHLRGEENLRALSSELREAIFMLRTPQRALGVDPREVKLRKPEPRRGPLPKPQVRVREEENFRALEDQVQWDPVELCKKCGNDLDGVDPRRCPVCLRQAAAAMLDLLLADGRFLFYRVFLTICRKPVASRAVYRLRDFNPLPSGSYCVQAA